MTWMVLPAAICPLPPEKLFCALHPTLFPGIEETLRPIHHNQNSPDFLSHLFSPK
jgi:hypothetical protein